MTRRMEAAAGRPFRSLDLAHAEVLVCPDFFPTADADRLLRELVATTAWRQEVFRIFGRENPLPAAACRARVARLATVELWRREEEISEGLNRRK